MESDTQNKLPTKGLQCFSKNKMFKRQKEKSQDQVTKNFYLTKFYFMHKHDSLPCLSDFGNKKQNKKQNISSLVQNSDNAKGEGSPQFYCRIIFFFFKRPLPLWPYQLSVQTIKYRQIFKITSSLLQDLQCYHHPPLAIFPE